MVDLADERGMGVSVDGIQDHLSSFDFLPAWTRTWHAGSMFTDSRIINGLTTYLKAIASHLADHPNFLGMSLGNEVSQFGAAVHPDQHRQNLWEPLRAEHAAGGIPHRTGLGPGHGCAPANLAPRNRRPRPRTDRCWPRGMPPRRPVLRCVDGTSNRGRTPHCGPRPPGQGSGRSECPGGHPCGVHIKISYQSLNWCAMAHI